MLACSTPQKETFVNLKTQQEKLPKMKPKEKREKRSKAAVSCGTISSVTKVPQGVRETGILFEDLTAKTFPKGVKSRHPWIQEPQQNPSPTDRRQTVSQRILRLVSPRRS